MSTEFRASKSLSSSKTVWAASVAFLSVLLAFLVDNWSPISDILNSAGVSPDAMEGVFKIVAGISSLLAIWGRMVAKHIITLLVLFLIPIGMVGCNGVGAGAYARDKALAPEAVAAWAEVQDDALYGIDAQVRDGVISEPYAESRRLTVELFNEGVLRLR